MKLIDKALDLNKRTAHYRRYKTVGALEAYIRDEYCPMFFFEALKPYTPNQHDRSYCVYDDSLKSASATGPKCKRCWDREWNYNKYPVKEE